MFICGVKEESDWIGGCIWPADVVGFPLLDLPVISRTM